MPPWVAPDGSRLPQVNDPGLENVTHRLPRAEAGVRGPACEPVSATPPACRCPAMPSRGSPGPGPMILIGEGKAPRPRNATIPVPGDPAGSTSIAAWGRKGSRDPKGIHFRARCHATSPQKPGPTPGENPPGRWTSPPFPSSSRTTPSLLFREPGDAALSYTASSFEEILEETEGRHYSLLFRRPDHLPRPMRKEIARKGWTVAAPAAHPILTSGNLNRAVVRRMMEERPRGLLPPYFSRVPSTCRHENFSPMPRT
jgi:hypothetical protein